MRLTSLVVWKSWVSNPLRTGLTVIGIALGVAVVTAIHVMDHNTIQSRLRELRPDFGRVDFELVPEDRSRDPGAIRAELQRVDGIGAVGLLHSATITVTVPDGRAGAAQAYGLSPLPSEAFAHYVVAQGADLDDLDGDEFVLIGEELAADLDVTVGDTLVVAAPAITPRAQCKGGQIVRTQRDPSKAPIPAGVRIKGVLGRHGLARRNFGRVIIGSFALSKRMAPGQHTFFQVNRSYGANADRLRQVLSEDFQVLDEHSALLGEASDERAFRNGVKILGCLALVLGMFVVFQTLSQSLVERLRQIGLLRCLGASRRSVVAIFLLDAVLMAAIGVGLGVGLGVVLASALQNAQFTTLGVGKHISTFEVPVVPLVWTGALGLLFTLMGAVFPLYKARNLPAIQILNARGLDQERGADVLRGVNVFLFVLLVLVLPGAYLAMTTLSTDSERETRAVLMQLGGLILAFGAVLLLSPKLVQTVGRFVLRPWRRFWPLPEFLVRRSLERSSGRFAASVCGLAIVLLAMIALSSITSALRGEIEQFGERTMNRRVFLGLGARQDGSPPPQPVTPTIAKSLESIPGVARVEIHEGRRSVPFLLSGIRVDELTRAGGVLEPHPDLVETYTSERSVIVSRRLARLYGVGPGGTLGVLTDEGRKPYRVLRVSDDAGFWVEERAWAVASPRWMNADFCVGDECVDAATIHLDDGVWPVQVKSAVQARLPDFTRFRPGENIVDYHLRDLTRDFLLFDVLLSLILALAVMGLVNQMTIAAMARVREVGVLRALGMSKHQLRQGFLVESMVVAALAAVTAIVLGVPLGMLVVDGLNRVTGLEAPFVVPWAMLGTVVLIALAVGLIASVLPGLRAAKLSPAESVRYE